MNKSSDATPAIPPMLPHFRALAPNYDLVLCDVWGVVHNGQSAYESACDALKRARAAGVTVLMISNAPRPGEIVKKQIARWGVPAGCYDDIVASGDVAREVLEKRPGAKIFHLGPERDLPNYAGLDGTLVGEEQADIVVVTGPFNDETETPDDYREMFAGMRKRNQLMLCANPDLVVERGDKLIWCAGALAAVYEELGGKVIYAGKPHAPIYDLTYARAAQLRGKSVPKNRVIAIGDGARTDLKGAALQGIDCLFVTGGIHAADFAEENGRAGEVFAEQGAWPLAMMHRLAW